MKVRHRIEVLLPVLKYPFPVFRQAHPSPVIIKSAGKGYLREREYKLSNDTNGAAVKVETF